MYAPAKSLLLSILRAPAEPPESPMGSPDSVRVFRAAPNYFYYQCFGLFVAGGVLLLGEGFGFVAGLASHEFAVILVTGVLFGLSVLGLGFSYFLRRLEYEMRYYIVTDRSLRIREGVMVIRESTITFANVQNLTVHQGPIQRLLGISDLVVETAGGGGKASGEGGRLMSGHHGVFGGISNASEVRDLVLELLKKYRDAGLGDPGDHRHHAPSSGFSPESVERLREIRDLVRRLDAALS